MQNFEVLEFCQDIFRTVEKPLLDGEMKQAALN